MPTLGARPGSNSRPGPARCAFSCRWAMRAILPRSMPTRRARGPGQGAGDPQGRADGVVASGGDDRDRLWWKHRSAEGRPCRNQPRPGSRRPAVAARPPRAGAPAVMRSVPAAGRAMVPEITPGPELPAPRAIGRQASSRRFELNLPNLITLARLLSVPLTIWLIFGERYGTAFWVFAGAGLSDALDGYIAKRFDRRTWIGALLDPAADKAMLAGVYVSLGLVGQLPVWLVGLVVSRDLLIVLGFFLIHAAAVPKQFDPLYISKLNTLVQIALVGFVLGRLGLDIETGAATWLLIAA